MKLWLPPIFMFNCTNRHGPIFSNTLYSRHHHSLLLRRPHLPRRKLRVTNPQHTRQRRIIFLYLHLHTHRPRIVLRLIPLQRNLKRRRSLAPPCYNDCLCWLRPTLRPDIFLRRHRYHKPPLRRPLCRKCPGSMNLRRVLSRQCHTNPLLCFPLPIPLCHYCLSRNSPSLLTRNRLHQPSRLKLRLR